MTSWPTKLSALSLREKLPLAGSALIGGVLLVAGALAYVEVRQAAFSESEDRLAALSSELVALMEAELEVRRELQEHVGASREVRGALLTSRVDTADLTRVLDSLRSPADRDLPVGVAGPEGRTIFSIGGLPAGTDPDPEPPLRSVRAYGPLRAMADQNLYWETVPVLGTDEGVLGWIVQRRRLESTEELGRLWGRGIQFHFGQITDSVWVDLLGEKRSIAPGAITLGAAFTRAGQGEEPSLAWGRRVDRTPWVVLLSRPLSQVFARPRAFLARMILLGGLVITGSIVLVWWGSRRLTRPLIELAGAADAVSRGDYDRRVEVADDDEIGRLAGAFNRMSEQVARSEAALNERLAEARRLAEHLVQARRAAEEARRDAEDANQAKADILAAISHEIRTPISAVTAYAEMLQNLDPARDGDRHRKYVRRIEECTEMLASLTDDVLDFSCIETGQLRVEIGPGSVEDVTRFAAASLEPRARAKGVVISNVCSGDLTFLGDRQRVQQIVVNLVSNAVKFTPDGGRVTVRCQRLVDRDPRGADEGGRPWIAIHVEDTGPGIAREEIERIFQPFQRAGNGDGTHPGGIGLGLSISRQLAEMMSGALTVQTRLGVGSRFTLWLPSSARTARHLRPARAPRREHQGSTLRSPDA